MQTRTTGHKNIIIIRQSIFKNHTILLHYYSILVHIWNGLYTDLWYNFMHITSYMCDIQMWKHTNTRKNQSIFDRSHTHTQLLVSFHIFFLNLFHSNNVKIMFVSIIQATQESDSRENSNFSIPFIIMNWLCVCVTII